MVLCHGIAVCVLSVSHDEAETLTAGSKLLTDRTLVRHLGVWRNWWDYIGNERQ